MCIDLNCKKNLKNKYFKIKMYIMILFLRIQKIDAITHEINKYVKIIFYFFKIKNKKRIFT